MSQMQFAVCSDSEENKANKPTVVGVHSMADTREIPPRKGSSQKISEQETVIR